MHVPLEAPVAYATFSRLKDFLDLGWCVAADLGPVHGRYSCLVAWLCRCRDCRMPK